MQITSLLFAVFGLLVVLALVLLAGRVARRLGLPGRLAQSGGRLAPVQALSLDGRRRLHLLRCDGRCLLLLTGGANDLFVGWVEPPPVAAEPPP